MMIIDCKSMQSELSELNEESVEISYRFDMVGELIVVVVIKKITADDVARLRYVHQTLTLPKMRIILNLPVFQAINILKMVF